MDGLVGTTIDIQGVNLGGASSVSFNGTAASFTINSDSEIQATIPSGATPGPITVTTPNGTATSSSSFTVDAPSIDSFAPTSALVGGSVVITGSNFAGATSVEFNGTPATFTVSSNWEIYASVPSGATTGPISVTTPTGTGTSLSALTVVDDTTITSGPSGTVNSTSATFTFSASEPSTFDCSLDGSAFSECLSPATYTGLAAGSHTFQVRATDAAGNTDPTPAQRTWTVDTTPPDTTITSGPSGTVNSPSATFAFTASEAATFTCSLDGAAYTACSTPKTYTGLGFGSHTFQVRATDAAGNTDPTPAQRTWTVNAPPTARFTFSCAALTCSFDGSSSSDSDGSIQSYNWGFGDGTTGTGSNPPARTYAQAASFTVTLAVTDNDGATGSVSHTVTLINLIAQVRKTTGTEKVALSWSGPDGTNFGVYRNGSKIATVSVKSYTDTLQKKGTYTYKVCAPTTSTCSNQTSVTF
jgi:hypothetical protein